ncbi:ABC transporter ATP-binding protein [Clostridium formicaceticum]|uniref:Sn-glycerol-3-phosphate import ATP-binding protein UgpC n=1 Tax=Clostridium formicaceticum TaxID=1497 RepID=A0AAC9WHC8_9CLOT|nr:sn-glycerol-3-phosphate ABC transporter ATP-binding protein UgpC [Clostridium formicaceticum]AOY78486.1 sugar ABC transporter ATP-binding protein [Clostridium formicaceticum]ARE88664.1 sn-glycerol-3-phosphate import ATP-binding protein UgpC [Clostridium formicaceticum]
MANVNLKHVTKKFEDKVVAVADFNLDIEDKEFIVFVGPSGCGKTTTLRMVAGLEEVTEGEIFIDGRLVNHMQPKDRDIAMVFQNYALYPHMTVFENMAYSLKLKKIPKNEIKASVYEAAKLLEIEHLLHRKPKALSGGQRQRVALGRAIVRKPKVFLMDEPLSNLDAKLRAQMRTKISKLHQQLQTTFIYVTHDQTEAMTMGTRIVVMKDGYIQQMDSPQRLYEKPNNLFVAGFIGSPQMNFREVMVEKFGEEIYLKFGKSSIKLPYEKAKKLEELNYLGREVIMGIRPEAIFDQEIYLDSLADCVVEAEVEVVEMLGSEILLNVKIEGTDFIAKVDPQKQVKVGEIIKLALDPGKIHIFDKETEKTITNT